MLKVIIFDADGVLIPSKKRFSSMLAEEYGISLKRTSLFFEGPFQDCLIGKLDLKEAISPYLKEWGWKKGVKALLEHWFWLEREVDKELIEYIRQLRHQGMLCFLATNQEKYRFGYILDQMKLKKSFDKTYASAHLGYKKPDIRFFKKIYDEFGDIKKKEILFVDDDIEHIKSAKEFGINTERYTSFDRLKRKISFLNSKKFGNKKRNSSMLPKV